MSSKSRPTHLTGTCSSMAHFCSRPHFDSCDRTCSPMTEVLAKFELNQVKLPCVVMLGMSFCAPPLEPGPGPPRLVFRCHQYDPPIHISASHLCFSAMGSHASGATKPRMMMARLLSWLRKFWPSPLNRPNV